MDARSFARAISFVEVGNTLTATVCVKTSDGNACISATVDLAALRTRVPPAFFDSPKGKQEAEEAIDSAARIIAARRLKAVADGTFEPLDAANVQGMILNAGTAGVLDVLSTIGGALKTAVTGAVNVVAPGAGTAIGAALDTAIEWVAGNPAAEKQVATIAADAKSGNPEAKEAHSVLSFLAPAIDAMHAQAVKAGREPAAAPGTLGSAAGVPYGQLPVIIVNTGNGTIKRSEFERGAQAK